MSNSAELYLQDPDNSVLGQTDMTVVATLEGTAEQHNLRDIVVVADESPEVTLAHDWFLGKMLVDRWSRAHEAWREFKDENRRWQKRSGPGLAIDFEKWKDSYTRVSLEWRDITMLCHTAWCLLGDYGIVGRIEGGVFGSPADDLKKIQTELLTLEEIARYHMGHIID